MKQKGVNYTDIARACNTSRQVIQTAVNSGNISMKTAQRIARGLGVPLWYIFIQNDSEAVKYIAQRHTGGATGAVTVCPHCGKPLRVNITAEP